MTSWLHLAVVALCSLVAALAEQLYDDDAADMYMSKRFLRFGRASEPDDPYLLVPGGTFHKPYSKRFLRFGRASEPTVDDYARAIALLSAEDEPVFRIRRSVGDAEVEAAANVRKRRSADVAESEVTADSQEKHVEKREAADDLEEEKRFMRFGKRFMRFGKSVAGVGPEKRFMRFGKSVEDDKDSELELNSEALNDVDKRFMRFGKRFMRFGKRADGEEEKRFMRFGKRDDEEPESEEKRFMRFGKSLGDNELDNEKRFMRFGKRFMRFGKSLPETDEEMDKRFMRFGKRFMRFGKSVAGHGPEEKRFMRFGRR